VALILRAADRSSAPWKNGGGLTREVAVHPAGSDLDTFDWRVSLAEVRRGGAFSCFAGVDRHMAVISGRLGLSLSGREPLSLSSASPPLTFPGEVPVYAEPGAEPVTDLNVMTRRGRFLARMTRCSAAESTELRLEADTTTLLLALAPLTLRAASIAAKLAALDAARFSPSAQTLSVQPAAPGATFWLIDIRAA
jgi:environmental stress-induced protein Ves